MIEFNGYITGTAEKYFKKKSIKLNLLIILFSSAVCLPCLLLINRLIYIEGLVPAVFVYSYSAMIIFLFGCFSKKFIKYTKPKRIIIESDNVICEIHKDKYKRRVNNVKCIYDFGDFYDMRFFNCIDYKYICQKNLISEGSVEEFEALFEGKIIKKVE